MNEFSTYAPWAGGTLTRSSTALNQNGSVAPVNYPAWGTVFGVRGYLIEPAAGARAGDFFKLAKSGEPNFPFTVEMSLNVKAATPNGTFVYVSGLDGVTVKNLRIGVDGSTGTQLVISGSSYSLNTGISVPIGTDFDLAFMVNADGTYKYAVNGSVSSVISSGVVFTGLSGIEFCQHSTANQANAAVSNIRVSSGIRSNGDITAGLGANRTADGSTTAMMAWSGVGISFNDPQYPYRRRTEMAQPQELDSDAEVRSCDKSTLTRRTHSLNLQNLPIEQAQAIDDFVNNTVNGIMEEFIWVDYAGVYHTVRLQSPKFGYEQLSYNRYGSELVLEELL